MTKKFESPESKENAVELIANLADKFNIKSNEVGHLINDDKHLATSNLFLSYIGVAILFFGFGSLVYAVGPREPLLTAGLLIFISMPLHYLGLKVITVGSKPLLEVPLIGVAVIAQTLGLLVIFKELNLSMNVMLLVALAVCLLTCLQQWYFARLKGSAYLMGIAGVFYIASIVILSVFLQLSFIVPLLFLGVSLCLLGRYFKKTKYSALSPFLDFLGVIAYFAGASILVYGLSINGPIIQQTSSLSDLVLLALTLFALWFGSNEKSAPILFISLINLTSLLTIVLVKGLGANFAVAIVAIVVGLALFFLGSSKFKKQQS